MPVGGRLVPRGGAEERGLVERPPDELEADRQAGLRESARQRDCRLTGQVEREGQVEERRTSGMSLSPSRAVVAPMGGAAIGLVGVTRTSNDRHNSR